MATQKTDLFTGIAVKSIADLDRQVDALHKAFAGGQESREKMMLTLVAAVEAKVLDATSDRKAAKVTNLPLYERFAMWRDGKRSSETSDLSLRSRFVKCAAAAAALRDKPRKFSAVMNDVATVHARMNAAKDKEGAKQPVQLLEAFYRAAKLQLDGDEEQNIAPSDDAIGGNVITLAVTKPEPPKASDADKLKAAIEAAMASLDKLVGKQPDFVKGAIKPEDFSVLKAAHDRLSTMTGGAPAAPTLTAEQLVAFQAWQAAQAAETKKNGKRGTSGK